MKYMKLASVALSAAFLLCGCGGGGVDDPAALLENGQYEAAAEGFSELIKSDEKNADLYIGLADAYLGQGEYEAAVDILCDGFEASEDEDLTEKMLQITSDLYKTATEKTDYQVVLYCCDRALDCGEFAEIYEIKAMCYINMEQYDKVAETVNTGIEKTSDSTIAENVAGYFYTLGSKAYTAGDKKLALEYFNKVIEIDSENTDAANMIKAIGDNPEDTSDKKEEEKPEKQEVKKPQDEVSAQTDASEPSAKQEPAVTPAPATQTTTYTVQIGAYSSKENADSKIAKANAAGLSASSYISGGLYRVTVGSFASVAEAEAAVAKANAAGFDAIIIE